MREHPRHNSYALSPGHAVTPLGCFQPTLARTPSFSRRHVDRARRQRARPEAHPVAEAGRFPFGSELLPRPSDSAGAPGIRESHPATARQAWYGNTGRRMRPTSARPTPPLYAGRWRRRLHGLSCLHRCSIVRGPSQPHPRAALPLAPSKLRAAYLASARQGLRRLRRQSRQRYDSRWNTGRMHLRPRAMRVPWH